MPPMAMVQAPQPVSPISDTASPKKALSIESAFCIMQPSYDVKEYQQEEEVDAKKRALVL